MKRMRYACSISMLIVLLSATSTFAASRDDLQVAARAFAFIRGIPEKNVSISIVYNENNAVSKEDALRTHALLKPGFSAGGYVLTSTLVEAKNSKNISSDVAYITQKMEGDEEVFNIIRSKKMLSFSTDFNCVAQKKCVMAVAAKPNVKIEISRTAANWSWLEFDKALVLLVKEKE